MRWKLQSHIYKYSWWSFVSAFKFSVYEIWFIVSPITNCSSWLPYELTEWSDSGSHQEATCATSSLAVSEHASHFQQIRSGLGRGTETWLYRYQPYFRWIWGYKISAVEGKRPAALLATCSSSNKTVHRHVVLVTQSALWDTTAHQSRHVASQQSWPNPVDYRIWSVMQEHVYQVSVRDTDELQQRLIRKQGLETLNAIIARRMTRLISGEKDWKSLWAQKIAT